jgi:hypothetical protein
MTLIYSKVKPQPLTPGEGAIPISPSLSPSTNDAPATIEIDFTPDEASPKPKENHTPGLPH